MSVVFLCHSFQCNGGLASSGGRGTGGGDPRAAKASCSAVGDPNLPSISEHDWVYISGENTAANAANVHATAEVWPFGSRTPASSRGVFRKLCAVLSLLFRISIHRTSIPFVSAVKTAGFYFSWCCDSGEIYVSKLLTTRPTLTIFIHVAGSQISMAGTIAYLSLVTCGHCCKERTASAHAHTITPTHAQSHPHTPTHTHTHVAYACICMHLCNIII